MTISEGLHTSKFHREGFDPNCPGCLKEQGISGIIQHLKACIKQNELDNQLDPCGDAAILALISEQKRMLNMLKLYQQVKRES